jgi:hypothetical protein
MDVAVFEDYIIHGGAPLYSDQREWLLSGKGSSYGVVALGEDGCPQFPELILSHAGLLPAWDAKGMISQNSAGGSSAVELWDTQAFKSFADERIGEQDPQQRASGDSFKRGRQAFFALTERSQRTLSDFPMTSWRMDGINYIYACVLTKDSIIVINADGKSDYMKAPETYVVRVLNRADGSERWKLELSEEPRMGGCAVTADGEIILTYREGGMSLIR